jgi:hypothetical protein
MRNNTWVGVNACREANDLSPTNIFEAKQVVVEAAELLDHVEGVHPNSMWTDETWIGCLWSLDLCCLPGRPQKTMSSVWVDTCLLLPPIILCPHTGGHTGSCES